MSLSALSKAANPAVNPAQRGSVVSFIAGQGFYSSSRKPTLLQSSAYLGRTDCLQLQRKFAVQAGIRVAAQASYAAQPVAQEQFAEIGEVDWSPEMVNSVNLIGNTGKDVEVKYLESQQVVGKVTLAVQGRNKRTDWFEIEMWGPLAERARDSIRKGQKIAVQGRLKTDDWTDRNGQTRKTIKVVANSVQMVKAYGRGQTQEYPESNQQAYGQQGYDQQMYEQQQQFEQPFYQEPTQSYDNQQQGYYNQQPAGALSPKEELWMDYFNNPNGWWDNREKKLNARSPDFKRRGGSEALWIDARDTPQWVHQRFEEMQQGGGQPQVTTDANGVEIPF